MQSIQGVQLEALWYFGITKYLSWLSWKNGNTKFRAALRTVDKIVWVFTGVYGLVCSRNREAFGRSLGQ